MKWMTLILDWMQTSKLEDLDAELDAEMDSVDETIEHEEESVESDELDIERISMKKMTMSQPPSLQLPRKTQDEALGCRRGIDG